MECYLSFEEVIFDFKVYVEGKDLDSFKRVEVEVV